MYNRLYNFLAEHNIISKKQYGFRENYSTYMAIIDLVDNISNNIDIKKHSIGIFLDLSKAFDTIDHKILLRKLQRYGVRGIACDWFKSYLVNRVQYVYNIYQRFRLYENNVWRSTWINIRPITFYIIYK